MRRLTMSGVTPKAAATSSTDLPGFEQEYAQRAEQQAAGSGEQQAAALR
jgi:hypothetical protein